MIDLCAHGELIARDKEEAFLHFAAIGYELVGSYLSTPTLKELLHRCVVETRECAPDVELVGCEELGGPVLSVSLVLHGAVGLLEVE